jgi:hypothetical protein
MAKMPMLTTYSALPQAHAFIRDEQDEDAEVVAVDHPDFYCTRVHGVYRAPLPMLVDRGELSPEEFEEQAAEAAEEGFDLFGEEDEFTALADRYYDPSEDEDDGVPYFAVGHADNETPVATVTHLRPGRTVDVRKDTSEVEAPIAISSRRAILAGPKVIVRETGPDRHCWKDNTSNGRQFLRHARG